MLLVGRLDAHHTELQARQKDTNIMTCCKLYHTSACGIVWQQVERWTIDLEVDSSTPGRSTITRPYAIHTHYASAQKAGEIVTGQGR